MIWDYSFYRPSIATLHANGVTAVSRYLDWGLASGKCISKTELIHLLSNGIDVYLNWESTGHTATGGSTEGKKEATEAFRLAKLLGVAEPKIIFTSTDYDAAGDAPLAYHNGCAAIGGHANVGLYGGVRVIDYMCGGGVNARSVFGWQTYAWSGGKVSRAADLYQYHNGTNFDQDKIVKNGVAVSADTSGFAIKHYGSAPTPVPVHTPHPFAGRVLIYQAGTPMMHGSDVQEWQSRMHDRWKSKIKVDGVYGEFSQAVCKAFQKLMKLHVDGEVGPITWAASEKS